MRIAYLSGSDSHQPDLDMLEGPVAVILDRYAEAEFVVVGPVEPGPGLARFGDRVTSLGHQPWRELATLLADIDINVAPLVLPSEFNDAKSAVKWLEASSVGVPTVATASAAFAAAIDHGRTGLLCSTPDEWIDALDRLLGDPALRARLGAAAQREAELHHGPHITAHAYEQALSMLVDRRAQRPASSWTAVAPDERAPSAPPLDTYDIGDVEVRTVGQRVGRFIRRLRRG